MSRSVVLINKKGNSSNLELAKDIRDLLTKSLDALEGRDFGRQEPMGDSIVNIINDFLVKGYRAGGSYVPVTTLVHHKDGSVSTAIRWKSYEEVGLIKIKAGPGAVKTLGESLGFASKSAIQQMMFLLVEESAIEEIEQSNFVPMIEYNLLGEGLYMYSNLELAVDRAEKHNKKVLPVKINVQKLYSSTLEKIKNEKLDEIRNQNFDGIIITRGSVHEFDVFCFDNRAAIVVGENEGKVGQHE
jgi:hypothetical protein